MASTFIFHVGGEYSRECFTVHLSKWNGDSSRCLFIHNLHSARKNIISNYAHNCAQFNLTSFHVNCFIYTYYYYSPQVFTSQIDIYKKNRDICKNLIYKNLIHSTTLFPRSVICDSFSRHFA